MFPGCACSSFCWTKEFNFLVCKYSVCTARLQHKVQPLKVVYCENHMKPTYTLLQAWTGPLGSRGLRIPEFLGRHKKVARLSTYTPAEFIWLISVTRWVHLRAIGRLEGINQWEIPMTPSGIEPATFRLLGQCLNELCHRLHHTKRMCAPYMPCA